MLELLVPSPGSVVPLGPSATPSVGADCAVGAFGGAVGGFCGAVGAFGGAICNFGTFGSAFAGAVGAFGIAVGNEGRRGDQ